MTYGERIKQLRKMRGMSAEDLAEATGISPATIYRYENGSTEEPKASMLRRIAFVLDISAENLMHDDPAAPATIGERIQKLRQRQGLTLEALGDHCGVGKSTVRKWESGIITSPSADMLAPLAEALHTTPSALCGWDEACNTTSTTQVFISPALPHRHEGGTHMAKITLNDLLTLTNARTVRCAVSITPRLTAVVTADITQMGQLDDLSALYGNYEITEVDTMDGRLEVAIRQGGGSHDD